jgi:hypothetical protein
MALFGHPTCTEECPLSGVKRTWRERAVMSANDPKRTSERRGITQSRDRVDDIGEDSASALAAQSPLRELGVDPSQRQPCLAIQRLAISTELARRPKCPKKLSP